MKSVRLALYARVSTNDKDQNPETQLRPLREHAAGLADAVTVGEFVDRAGTDDLRGRREWRRLMELALKRQVDLVVVWRLDRAFRSVVDGATTLRTLRTAGCGIRSLSEPWIDTTTPIGEAMYHITIAWAQLEKRQLTERVKAGMERARAEGKTLGRPPRPRGVTEHPFWPRVLRALEAATSTGPRRPRSSASARPCSSRPWRRSQKGVPLEMPRTSAGTTRDDRSERKSFGNAHIRGLDPPGIQPVRLPLLRPRPYPLGEACFLGGVLSQLR